MFRWMSGATCNDLIQNEDSCDLYDVASFLEKLLEQRLRGFGTVHVIHAYENALAGSASCLTRHFVVVCFDSGAQ